MMIKLISNVIEELVQKIRTTFDRIQTCWFFNMYARANGFNTHECD